MTEAGKTQKNLIECLSKISNANGYHTQLQGVYPESDTVRDEARYPCALVSVGPDTINSVASNQASRIREYGIEVVFKRGTPQEVLDQAHVDVLRALGFGKNEFERDFKGLLTDEQSAEFLPNNDGSMYTSVLITVAVAYVETYL